METPGQFYLQKLRLFLERTQEINPQYSLRAFARDLALDPSTLSQIIKGKRSMPFKNARLAMDRLELGPEDRTLFMESLGQTKTTLDDIKVKGIEERFILGESYYKVIAEWEHYLVIDLFDLEDFTPTIFHISQRLGISVERTEVVVKNLLTSGLLKLENGELVRTHARIRTTEDIKSDALKAAHREVLDLGKAKLDEVPLDQRDFSLLTVPLDPEKLPEAKAIIREFRLKMMALLKDGKKSEVYQLAIQLYPMTKTLEAQDEKIS